MGRGVQEEKEVFSFSQQGVRSEEESENLWRRGPLAATGVGGGRGEKDRPQTLAAPQLTSKLQELKGGLFSPHPSLPSSWAPPAAVVRGPPMALVTQKRAGAVD